MNQTGYVPVLPFSKGLNFVGGFCQWWFTPWQNITVWPGVDPLTQFLDSEPTLANGATWFGPIKVPNNKLGFTEEQKLDKAGIYYNQNVSGFYPGDSGTSRINLENLPYNQFAVVGKMRAGGLFLLLGNEEYGLTFNHKLNSDIGAGTAGSNFSFGYESVFKGAILPAFQGLNVTPPLDGSGNGVINGSGDGQNNTQIIVFTNATEVNIPWTTVDKTAFGAYPLIEVWIDDSGTGSQRALANVPIIVDQFPPDTTMFTVQLSGPCSGIVVIK